MVIRGQSPERTNEQQLIEKATKDLYKAVTLIERLRHQCLQRGVEGILAFGRMFRRMDKDRNGSLSREEFAVGLKETQMTVEHHDVVELLRQFDTDNNGRINYDEFLTALRPPLNDCRREVIDLAFDKMDHDRDGVVNIEDMKKAYNINYHPAYLNGDVSKDVILKAYLTKFEQNGSVDGRLTREEFTDYYSGVSASIDNDIYFIMLMKSSWKL